LRKDFRVWLREQLQEKVQSLVESSGLRKDSELKACQWGTWHQHNCCQALDNLGTRHCFDVQSWGICDCPQGRVTPCDLGTGVIMSAPLARPQGHHDCLTGTALGQSTGTPRVQGSAPTCEHVRMRAEGTSCPLLHACGMQVRHSRLPQSRVTGPMITAEPCSRI